MTIEYRFFDERIWSDTGVSTVLIQDLHALMQYLAGGHVARPTRDSINRVAERARLLIAWSRRDASPHILGTATLVPIVSLRHWSARIEDVVVDPGNRGRGIGRELLRRLIEEARRLHCERIDLTSRSGRGEANRLYKTLGFVRRDTNVYRLSLT